MKVLLLKKYETTSNFRERIPISHFLFFTFQHVGSLQLFQKLAPHKVLSYYLNTIYIYCGKAVRFMVRWPVVGGCLGSRGRLWRRREVETKFVACFREIEIEKLYREIMEPLLPLGMGAAIQFLKEMYTPTAVLKIFFYN